MTTTKTVSPTEYLKQRAVVNPVSKNVVVDRVPVDKALAQQWLEHNINNRNTRPRQVSAYARDMAAGNWHDTASPVQFDKEGNLLNGQHRLLAIIQADVVIWLWVFRGLESEAQGYMDVGGKRNVGDAMTLKGIDNGRRLATTARVLFMFEHAYKPSHGETKALAEQELLINGLDESVHVGTICYKQLGGALGQYAAAYHLLKQVDARDAGIFFDKLTHGMQLEKGSPILALRNYLIRYSTLANNPAAVKVQFHMFFHAWNYWRKGKSLTRIQPRSAAKREPITPK